ncbi:MAG: sulfate adenylyltransferase [Chloroflexi bacterium]|nr:sulfate adenylyltransferase [Chloroflexota bacterium]MCH8222287.1 sulfate adenylyltransferase [Chloroflexota bacterium]
MIDPHGGVLVDRVFSVDEASDLRKRVSEMPVLKLNDRAASDLKMISIGAFSPLTGFMDREQYEGTVRDAHLPGGIPWTVPVTLTTDSATASGLREGDEIALLNGDGEPAGTLLLEEKFEYDRKLEAREVYRTEDEAHPGVANVYSQGEVMLGGSIRAVAVEPADVYAGSDRPPAETRRIFEEAGWNTIVGFQTRNPIHRAHEYIMKCALELVDGLLVHPLVGETKAGDIGAEVRMRCYRALLEAYYPADRTLLSVLPAFMRYAGPREAIFHAIMRKNYGCTHFIVGRDHAGVGDYYGTYDAQHIFREFDPAALGIAPMMFEHSFYCKSCGGMATAKTCPHPGEDHVFLSGTRVREMLVAGERPPPEFTRAEIADILIEAEQA